MSYDRFRDTASLLLAGGFVHPATTPAAFEFLDVPEQREEVERFLGRLGLRIATTASGCTWYAALCEHDEAALAQARATAADVKRELRHWIVFLKLALAAIDEPAPVAGALLHAHRLSRAVHDHLNLQESLRTLVQRLRSQPDASLQKQLESVLSWATRAPSGLLEVVDEAQGIFRLTGKVDWVFDMMAAFDEATSQKRGGKSVAGKAS